MQVGGQKVTMTVINSPTITYFAMHNIINKRHIPTFGGILLAISASQVIFWKAEELLKIIFSILSLEAACSLSNWEKLENYI